MNGISIGEAPQLSSVYGEYDNGIEVFGSPTGTSGYFNFVGTSLNEHIRVMSGGFGLPGGSFEQDNGLYLIGNTNGTQDFESVGTSYQISNSVIMGWEFSNTSNSNSNNFVLNGPDLSGHTNNVTVQSYVPHSYVDAVL